MSSVGGGSKSVMRWVRSRISCSARVRGRVVRNAVSPSSPKKAPSGRASVSPSV